MPLSATASVSRRAGLVFIPLFVLLAACTTTVGYFSYRNYERHFRVEVGQQLSAVAERRWARWRSGGESAWRMAPSFLGNAVFSGLVRRWFEAPNDAGARAQIREWLGKVQAAYQDQYDRVILLDARGVPRLSVPETPEPPAAHLSRDAPEVLRSGRVRFLDLHRDAPSEPVHLAVLAPILEGAEHPRPLGVILLRIDPEQYLYPFLQRWPTASRTAETLLVRRDGNDALFLNELRFQRNTALTLRSPLTSTNMPAVKAALGQEGVEEGVDYRGVPVLAAVRVVSDSPWSLVARMDIAEVEAPLRERLWMIVALVSVTLLAAGAGVGLIWRQQELRSARERYRAAEALNQSEARFRLVAESANDAVYEWDLRQGVEWSGRVDELLGYAPGEFPRTLDGWADALHPEDRERVMAAVQAHLAGRAPYSVEYRVRAKDGSYRSWSSRGVAVRLPDGTPRSWIGTVTDITERKRAEAALHVRVEALNAAANAVVITDREGHVEWVNPAFEALTGFSAEEALGKNPRELVKSGKHDRAFFAGLWNTILGGDVWRGEITNRRKDGSLYLEEMTITPVRDESGGIRHFVAIKSDVTGRRRLEQQLRAAQKMDAVGRLAGGVAHDFNNALAVILGFAERGLGRLAPLDPLHHDLRIVAGAGLWNVRIDASQVDQILVNLVTNARDAIPDVGVITVETSNVVVDDEACRTRPGLTPGEYVRLAVGDTGVGMDETTRGQVFEPFFTTKPEGKGTGLGLATVYGIVKQNGGFIDLLSEPGHGTTFEVYLPRSSGEAERPAEKGEQRPLTGTETVLLVEDEPALLEIVRETLESLGYTVLAAGSPGDAVLLCETHPGEIDVLLTDVVMPKMNGNELRERLERIKPGLRTVLMSGYVADATTHREIVDRGQCFIQKPFTREALASKIREALQG